MSARATASGIRWLVLAMAIAAVASAATIAARHGGFTTYAGAFPSLGVLELAASSSLILGGVLSWRGRPRVAALALTAGLAWLAPDFVGWDAGPAGVRSIALLLPGFTFAAVVHLVAGAPWGRAGSLPGRALVVAVYLELAVVTAGRAALRDPFEDPDCWSDCATNVLLIHADREVARVLTHADLVFCIAVGLALPALAVARWVAASATARRVITPVLVTGSTFAAAQAVWASQVLWAPPEDPRRGAFATLFATRSAALLALGAAIAWGVLRTARARTAVGRLIADLRDAPAPLDLQRALARAVGDPQLTVAYPIAGGYVDARGRPVTVSAPDAARAITSIERDGAPVAVVLHDRASLGEADLVREIGAAARLAVDNGRLEAQSHAQLAELRASRARVVETADAARRQLERDLHDGAQQRLVSLALMLRLAADSLDPRVAARLGEAEAELRAATAELRELAHGIHPAALSEEGLGSAIRALADRVPIAIEVLELPPTRLPSAVETAAYLLADEVARASDRATLSLRADAGLLALELAADGLDRAKLSHAGERIAALDGELRLDGGRVTARIPWLADSPRDR